MKLLLVVIVFYDQFKIHQVCIILKNKKATIKLTLKMAAAANGRSQPLRSRSLSWNHLAWLPWTMPEWDCPLPHKLALTLYFVRSKHAFVIRMRLFCRKQEALSLYHGAHCNVKVFFLLKSVTRPSNMPNMVISQSIA